MKTKRWLTTFVPLALAGVMLWAAPSFAQAGGKYQRGTGSQCPQGWGQGQGRGNANCPNSTTSTYCPRYGGANSQTPMGPRGPRGGRGYQAGTQTNPPAANQ